MLYNDKVGYGPTVSQALDGIFGSGAGATAADPGPIDGLPGAKPPTDGEQKAQAVEVPTPPVAVVPPGGLNLSATKAAALQEVQSALGAVREAQRSGNFAQYGAALQRLDEAMGKFDSAK
jgi:uncharacterized membrane protein (UPF0182 family)